MSKKKKFRPVQIDLSGASDETAYNILKALSEAEKAEKQKRTTRV